MCVGTAWPWNQTGVCLVVPALEVKVAAGCASLLLHGPSAIAHAQHTHTATAMEMGTAIKAMLLSCELLFTVAVDPVECGDCVAPVLGDVESVDAAVGAGEVDAVIDGDTAGNALDTHSPEV